MVIKASSAGEIRRLVDALGSGDEVRREAAVARLAIIGMRAVDRLVSAYNAASDRDTRIAILRALEPMRDRRTLPIARAAIRGGGDQAIAGAAALGGLLDSPDAGTAVAALDALASLALDETAERRVRLAAFDAQHMPAEIRKRVVASLGATAAPSGAAPQAAAWADAIEGRLPDDAPLLRDLVRARAPSAPLSELQTLIDLVRAREQAPGAAAKRAAWQGIRGALHQALALRGSRLAVYDLRESLHSATSPLPVSFLAALHLVGDGSCLPALAAAHAAAAADSRWRQQVAAAFHAIAKRERITKRHALMKRIAAKWPEMLAERQGSPGH
jgi:hypothetical protein